MKKIILFLVIIILTITLVKSGNTSIHENCLYSITKVDFNNLCNHCGIPENIDNWMQKIYFDKETGKYYSKYIWKNDTGIYLLLKEDKTDKMLFSMIKKEEE